MSEIHRTLVINHRQEGLSHADMLGPRGGIVFWPLSVCGWAGGSCVPRPDYSILCLVGLLPRCSRLTDDEASNQNQQQSKANGLHLSIRPVGSLRVWSSSVLFYYVSVLVEAADYENHLCECVAGIFSWWLGLLVTV